MPEPTNIDIARAHGIDVVGGPQGQESPKSKFEKKFEEKRKVFSDIRTDKGDRAVLEALAKNKTGLEPQKDPSVTTHDTILKQIQEAKGEGAPRGTSVDKSTLDRSFGTEKNDKDEFVLKPEEKSRKEKAVNAQTRVSDFIEKGFDSLDKESQKRVAEALKSGVNSIEFYREMLKLAPNGGKDQIESILRDDKLRDQLEIKLAEKLTGIEGNQKTLAENIVNAEKDLKTKRDDLKIYEDGIENRDDMINSNNEKKKEFEMGADGKPGKKLQDILDIGSVDEESIVRWSEGINKGTSDIQKIDNELVNDKRELGASKDRLKDVESSLRRDNRYLESRLNPELVRLEGELTGLTNDALKQEKQKEIDAVKAAIETEKKGIKEQRDEAEKLKEQIKTKGDEIGIKEKARAEKQAEVDEMGALKADEEKNRDGLAKLKKEEKDLVDNTSKLVEEKGELEKIKIDLAEDVRKAEKALADAVKAKADSEAGVAGDIDTVYKDAVLDYLAKQVKESADAQSKLDMKDQETAEIWKQFNDALNNEWSKESKRGDSWWPGGKKFGTAPIDKDKINRDFGQVVIDGNPDAIVKRILSKGVGLDDAEVEKKLLDPAFAKEMGDKVIKRLLANKLQVGQLTGSEVVKLALNTEWGSDAIDNAIKDNEKLMERFTKMDESGTLKGSKPSEWMNRVLKADNVDSKKRNTILSILMAIIGGTLGVGLVGGYSAIAEGLGSAADWVAGKAGGEGGGDAISKIMPL